MKPIQQPDTERDNKSAGDAGIARTPNTDMQAEDAGSESGGDGNGSSGGDDSATAATRAMKQTSKTAAESSGKR